MRSKQCLKPDQEGKGFFIQDDKTFGFGLNIPRTRHASEILKTTVQWQEATLSYNFTALILLAMQLGCVGC